MGAAAENFTTLVTIVVGPKLRAEGPKPRACRGISSCPREVDQSPTPAVFRAILGINLLL